MIKIQPFKATRDERATNITCVLWLCVVLRVFLPRKRRPYLTILKRRRQHQDSETCVKNIQSFSVVIQILLCTTWQSDCPSESRIFCSANAIKTVKAVADACHRQTDIIYILLHKDIKDKLFILGKQFVYILFMPLLPAGARLVIV